MYDILLAKDLRNKTALVVGCGSGTDAIYLAKLGARVHAFDLSPDMISLAEFQAAREAVDVEFRIMSAEQLSYSDNTFDVILVRDILHHCEVDGVLAELIRVFERRPASSSLTSSTRTRFFKSAGSHGWEAGCRANSCR